MPRLLIIKDPITDCIIKGIIAKGTYAAALSPKDKAQKRPGKKITGPFTFCMFLLELALYLNIFVSLNYITNFNIIKVLDV